MFLAGQRITGVEMEVTDEMRLLVAASAATLTCGWPEYEWNELAEVLLYPDSFDRDYNFGGRDAAGQVHHWGTVILAVPALNRSFDISSDGYHVGFHEFAHLLDLDQSRIDGTPPYLSDDSIRWWMKIVQNEEDRQQRGDSMLRPYAFSGPSEFFPTAVEAFFQTPVALAERHDELYAFLASYFAQDPASWSHHPERDDIPSA
jgi:MtfA peptidase